MNVKMKIMPESPDSNLNSIKEKIKQVLERRGATGIHSSEEPIAFGLKALIVVFQWDEEKELEETENLLKEINGVGSEEVVDMRRAIG